MLARRYGSNAMEGGCRSGTFEIVGVGKPPLLLLYAGKLRVATTTHSTRVPKQYRESASCGGFVDERCRHEILDGGMNNRTDLAIRIQPPMFVHSKLPTRRIHLMGNSLFQLGATSLTRQPTDIGIEPINRWVTFSRFL